ncbi:MAG TPA: tRNA pseudouridine(55) synthase TruB [Acidobacteriota bacterium]|nr:tRNA pseudouridine(55) synthase TruB [Acidobacteriota bacterium]
MTQPRIDLPGALLIDKPVGMTSHDVVDAVRRLYRTRAVGHCGTLDPAASGLLIILVRRATKVAALFSEQDKTYRATLHLGATSDTGDADGRITPGPEVPPLAQPEFESLLKRFQGDVTLAIPAYAAVRSGGRRRHELARRGLPVPEASRTVAIRNIDVLRYELPRIELRIDCSAGTYIRSLVEAIGDAVGCGAYLAGLRRERSGLCRVEDAFPLETLAERKSSEEGLPHPQPFERHLALPIIELSAARAFAVSQGQALRAEDIVSIEGQFESGATVLLRPRGGRVVAVAEARFSSATGPDAAQGGTPFRYRRVLI